MRDDRRGGRNAHRLPGGDDAVSNRRNERDGLSAGDDPMPNDGNPMSNGRHPMPDGPDAMRGRRERDAVSNRGYPVSRKPDAHDMPDEGHKLSA